MANPEPGGTYSFKVVAVRGNQQSNAVTASVKIPEAVPKEPEKTDQTIEDHENGNNNGINNGNETTNPGNGT